jgi:hypothetical protein
MFDYWKLLKLIPLGMLLIGGIVFLVSLNAFFKEQGSIDIVAGIVAIVGFYLLKPSPKDYYCAACGQYLGHSPRVCERCGCNRSTTQDPGAKR